MLGLNGLFLLGDFLASNDTDSVFLEADTQFAPVVEGAMQGSHVIDEVDRSSGAGLDGTRIVPHRYKFDPCAGRI